MLAELFGLDFWREVCGLSKSNESNHEFINHEYVEKRHPNIVSPSKKQKTKAMAMTHPT